MTSSLTAGKEVLAYCGKCRLTLAHVIVSMSNENTIHKVQCKTCQGTHAYKESAPAKRKKSSDAATKTATKSKSSKASGKKAPPTWDDKMAQTSHFLPYAFKNKYHLGEGIAHPLFGNGVVQELLESDKIAVLFENDVKILIHNKH